MHYINPYELLEITPENLSDADSATIKRAKKKLLAEIELGDTDMIIHQDIELNKSDCIRAIDDLDNKDKSEFHFFIYKHKHLKRFLTSGKISFFDNYQAESIYKLPEFLDFISQFFSEQYDKVLLENFKKWNQQAVAKILSVKPITNEAYFEKCFKSTHSLIKELDEEIRKFKKDIEGNKSPYISKKFVGLDNAILEKINVPLLNLLPSYFSNVRNQLAKSICDLAIEINNEHKIYEYSYKIIDIANNIETDGLCKQRIIKNYYTLKGNYTSGLEKNEAQKKETAENQLLNWWGKKATQIEAITKEIEEGISNYISSDFYSLDKVTYEIADPPKLNSLPVKFQAIRNEIASQISAVAVIVNNEPYVKYKIAYEIISIAYGIKSYGVVAENISSVYGTIKENYYDDVQKLQKKKLDAGNHQISSEWNSKTNQLKKILEEIKNGKSNYLYSNFSGLDKVIYGIVEPEKLNALPTKFQSVKNEVSLQINSLAIALNNAPHKNYRIAYALISIAYNINTEGDISETILTSYESIKKNYNEDLPKVEIENSIPSIENSNDYRVYLIGICAALVWALFNPIVQSVILSVSIAFLVFRGYYFFQHPEIFKTKKKVDRFFFLGLMAICICSFYSSTVATFYISYNLLLWGHRLYYDLFYNKNYTNDESLGYLEMPLKEFFFLASFIIALALYFYQSAQTEKTISSVRTENVSPISDNSSISSNNLNNSTDNSNSSNSNRPNSGNLYDQNNTGTKTTTSTMDFKIPNYIDAETFREVNPNEKLYGLFVGMKGDGSYSKKYSIFKKRFANESGMSELFRKQTESGKYSKSFNEFKQEYSYLPLAQDYTLAKSSPTSQTTSSADKDQNRKKMEDLTGYEASNYSTGNTPDCFNFTPKYDYSLDNKLEVSVGSTTDVAIKLISYSTGKCIRYVYIRSGATYDLTHIPQGKYYTKIAYGTDWRQKIVNGKCIGKFVSNSLYKKGSKVLNFNKIYKGADQYIPSFSLELSVKSTSFDIDKYDTNNINEDDFNQ